MEVLAVCLVVIVVVGLLMMTNPSVGPGECGYVYEDPRVFGKGGFRAILVGPAAYGLSFRRNLIKRIPVRARHLSVSQRVLFKDGNCTTLTVKLTLVPEDIKALIEKNIPAPTWELSPLEDVLSREIEKLAQVSDIGNLDVNNICTFTEALRIALLATELNAFVIKSLIIVRNK